MGTASPMRGIFLITEGTSKELGRTPTTTAKWTASGTINEGISFAKKAIPTQTERWTSSSTTTQPGRLSSGRRRRARRESSTSRQFTIEPAGRYGMKRILTGMDFLTSSTSSRTASSSGARTIRTGTGRSTCGASSLAAKWSGVRPTLTRTDGPT